MGSFRRKQDVKKQRKRNSQSILVTVNRTTVSSKRPYKSKTSDSLKDRLGRSI